MASGASFWILRHPRAPWGDDGRLLLHGMTDDRHDRSETVRLSRVGPYIPPVTFPGREVIVSEAVRSGLVSSGLTGLTFRPVEKVHVVRLDWYPSSLTDREPPGLSDDGEPEDPILKGDHSTTTSDILGVLWELVRPRWGEVRCSRLASGEYGYEGRLRLWEGNAPDVFVGEALRVTITSSAAKRVIEALAGDAVAFWPIEVEG